MLGAGETLGAHAWFPCLSCRAEPWDKSEFKNHLKTINDHLQPLFMSVVTTIGEADGEKYITLTNTTADAPAKEMMPRGHTVETMAFFQKMVSLACRCIVVQFLFRNLLASPATDTDVTMGLTPSMSWSRSS